MDRSDGTLATAPDGRFGRRVPRRALAAAIVGLVVVAVGAAIGIRSLRAATAPAVTVNPAYSARVFYKPTPITVSVNVSGLTSGITGSPVAGYQYGIQWDPRILRWVAGPGGAAPPMMPSCLKSVDLALTPTNTPTGTAPTFTPTFTVTKTATNTPLAGSTNTPTPTNTPWAPPTATNTFTPTATPGGFIGVACATLSNVTPVADSGTLDTYTFLPIATAAVTSPLNLLSVLIVDFNGNSVAPAATSSGGTVALVACHDVNGDGKVTLSDLIIIAGHYNTKVGDANYNPLYDVNSDGHINLADLIIEAAAYNMTC